MPQTYPVVCADRQDGREYTVQIAAATPQEALAKATKAGHITSRIDTGPAHAEHHPSETDELLRQIQGELRARRFEAQQHATELAKVIGRIDAKFTSRVAWGIILSMFLWFALVVLFWIFVIGAGAAGNALSNH